METIEEKDIKEIITQLSEERNAFWSEADFQYSFAWKIQQRYTNAHIRLERRHNHEITLNKQHHNETRQNLSSKEEPYYVDIWIELNDYIYPIELKYKTRAEVIKDCDGADITLLNQSAQDLGRYGYIKDINRIENIIKDYKGKKVKRGFAVILTNDPSYYTTPTSVHATNTLDKMFRIHQGTINEPIILHGDLFWSNKQKERITNTSHWTKKYPELHLDGYYNIMWYQYNPAKTQFYYCVTTIE